MTQLIPTSTIMGLWKSIEALYVKATKYPKGTMVDIVNPSAEYWGILRILTDAMKDNGEENEAKIILWCVHNTKFPWKTHGSCTSRPSQLGFCAWYSINDQFNGPFPINNCIPIRLINMMPIRNENTKLEGRYFNSVSEAYKGLILAWKEYQDV